METVWTFVARRFPALPYHVLMGRLNSSLPLLLAALKNNEQNLPFETLVETHLDTLLSFGQGHGGTSASYHVPTMVMLARTLAIAHQSTENMLASSAGQALGEERIKELERVGAIYGRIRDFIYDKINLEKERLSHAAEDDSTDHDAHRLGFEEVEEDNDASVNASEFEMIEPDDDTRVDGGIDIEGGEAEDWDIV